MTKDVVAIARSVLERHSTQEGALLPILRDLQDEFGYLPGTGFAARRRNLEHLPRRGLWRGDLLSRFPF